MKSSLAFADTFGIEAESPNENFEATNTLGGTLTSPFLVKDLAAASGGRYLEGEPGRKKIDAPPDTGVACYRFEVNSGGDYRIWGRVQAPSSGHDSFWVRMDSTGTWLAWNQIALGTSWHWDFVHANGAPTQPVVFPLDADTFHELCIAYREDGTRLDRLILTDDPQFKPTAPIAGAPVGPMLRAVMGKTTALVTWPNVLGATSYAVLRSSGGAFSTRASGLAGHSFQDTGLATGTSYCYVVKATGPTGSMDGPVSCSNRTAAELALVTETDAFSITPPLIFTGDSGGVILATPSGFNSLAAAPATGWARFDFQIAAAFRIKIWGKVVTPDNGSDSFWFRMDRGPWIKWNNWHPVGCGWDSLHDSDRNDAPVLFDLGLGTHSLEFAYREDDAGLDRIFIGTELRDPPSGCQTPPGAHQSQ